MTAASFTAVGLSAAPMAASAGESLPPGSASGLVFADVMVEAMACAPVEDAFALGITVEAGGERAGAFAPKQPCPSKRLNSPVASEGEEAAAATLEALAQAIAGQLRSPGVPVPPLAAPAEGEAGHGQQITGAAPQPTPLSMLKQPGVTERAATASSSQAPENSAQSGMTSGSPRDTAGRLQLGMGIESAAFTNAPASHLPDTAVPPWPSGIATMSGDGESTSENAGGLASLAKDIGKVPLPPLNSSGQPNAPAGPETRRNSPAVLPFRPPDEEQPAPARGPVGQAERVPPSLAGELAAEAGAFTAQPTVADRENHFLPVRPVHSAAEARFVPPPQTDSSALGTAPLPFRAGTGTAELGDGMKNATESKQFAGLPQQNLPELGVAFPAAAPELLRRGGVRPVLAAGDAKVRPDASAQLISLFPQDQPAFRATEEAGVLPAPLGANHPSPTESFSSNVLKHITELRHTGATEMAVVLKPDAETQLALRLTMGRNGEVLVQARCEQGDAQALAANWGEIRQSLAQQGVRLGALEFSPERGQDTFQPHAGNGGPSPDGQPSSQRHGQPWPETLDDLPLTGSLTEPLVRRGGPRPSAGRTRLLESWA